MNFLTGVPVRFDVRVQSLYIATPSPIPISPAHVYTQKRKEEEENHGLKGGWETAAGNDTGWVLPLEVWGIIQITGNQIVPKDQV